MVGTVVIGEGEMDEAPMLYTGEKLGTLNGPKFDIAVDPLEGTKFTANAQPKRIFCISNLRKRWITIGTRHIYGKNRNRIKLEVKKLMDIDYGVER